MLNTPTDKLYKFCAIFGLIVIFSTSYYYFNKDLDLRLQKNDLNTETKILNIQVNYLGERVKYLKGQVKSTLDENIEKERAIEYQKSVLEYENDLEKLEKITEEQIGKENAINIYTRAVNIYRLIFIFSLLIGLLSSILGFYKWYKSENK